MEIDGTSWIGFAVQIFWIFSAVKLAEINIWGSVLMGLVEFAVLAYLAGFKQDTVDKSLANSILWQMFMSPLDPERN
jgi:hypothetical protein